MQQRYIARDFGGAVAGTTTGTTTPNLLLKFLKNVTPEFIVTIAPTISPQVAYVAYLVILYYVIPKLEEKAL